MHEVKVKRSLNIKGMCIYWISMSEDIHIKLDCYFDLRPDSYVSNMKA